MRPTVKIAIASAVFGACVGYGFNAGHTLIAKILATPAPLIAAYTLYLILSNHKTNRVTKKFAISWAGGVFALGVVGIWGWYISAPPVPGISKLFVEFDHDTRTVTELTNATHLRFFQRFVFSLDTPLAVPVSNKQSNVIINFGVANTMATELDSLRMNVTVPADSLLDGDARWTGETKPYSITYLNTNGLTNEVALQTLTWRLPQSLEVGARAWSPDITVALGFHEFPLLPLSIGATAKNSDGLEAAIAIAPVTNLGPFLKPFFSPFRTNEHGQRWINFAPLADHLTNHNSR